MDIEKNDVDISKLFVWSKEVPIYDGNELVTTVYVRILGDADINRARVFALRESGNYRKALKTPGSDENLAFVSGIDTADTTVLIKSITLLRIADYHEQARQEADIKFPVEPPSDASLEEQEEYQKKIDEFPDIFTKEVDKLVQKKIEADEKKLSSIPEEALKKEYTNEIINYLCTTHMNEKFIDMCVYLGTYKDKKLRKKAFKSFDEYDNSSSELKAILKDAYSSIEIKVPDLKKSLEATP